jgi:hypothetical protein
MVFIVVFDAASAPESKNDADRDLLCWLGKFQKIEPNLFCGSAPDYGAETLIMLITCISFFYSLYPHLDLV